MENKKSILKKIELRAHNLCWNNYKKYFHSKIDDVIIENIMINGKCHIVSIFKNYLIEDDNSEYLHRYYKYKDIPQRLKYLFDYHIQTSVIFPNYCPIIESKYLYKNVIKKQRIIDEQQKLEEKKSKTKYNKNQKNKDILFTNSIYNEILNMSESVMRIIFGINNKKNLKKEIKKNRNISETKIDNGKENDLNSNKDNSELITLIKELDNAEKILKNNNMNKNKVECNLQIMNDNNSSKSKLITLKNTNNHLNDDKNYDLYNAKTNNSTARDFMPSIVPKGNSIITKSYNNIKTIADSNSQGNNLFLLNNEIKFENSSKKIKTSSSKKNIITPYRNLYELNFILKNPVINNLLKTNSNNDDINTNAKILSNGNNKNKKYVNIFNKPSFINKAKVNSAIKSNKSNKIINKKPKIDLGKLETFNNDLLSIKNRKKSRNFNEIFQKENLTINKTKNKNGLKSIIIPKSLSPLNKKDKIKNRNLAYASSSNVYTISNKRSHKSYFSNKNIKSSNNKLFINEYKCKNDSNKEKALKIREIIQRLRR